MKTKSLILIPVMFLLAPLIFAFSEDPSDYIFYDSGDVMQLNGTQYTPANGNLLTTQHWQIIGGVSAKYSISEPKIGNMSINITKASPTTNMKIYLGAERTNITVQFLFYDPGQRIYQDVRIQNDAGTSVGSIGIWNGVSGYYYYNDGADKNSNITYSTGWHNFTFYVAPSAAYTAFYIDGTKIANDTTTDGVSYLMFHNGDTPPVAYALDYIMIWSGKPEDQPQPGTEQDTTPPHITAYSDQGSSCSNWNIDTSNPCTTADTTPTLYFNTSEPAYCAIGVNNLNYTTMGSSRNCTAGEGTMEHACDLKPFDELVYEDSIVYLSCKDISRNENITSTSGSLSLTLTGLESGSESSIEIGIQNALLSGYTIYSGQQIYARKLAGTQDTGTFDRVAKKGSKVWAFNYITKGEEHVGLFNMTPVLYVLEMSNSTNSTIINMVETMINATK